MTEPSGPGTGGDQGGFPQSAGIPPTGQQPQYFQQPPPGEPNWGPPAGYPAQQAYPGMPAPPRKNLTGLWIGLGVLVFLVTAGIVGAIVVVPEMFAKTIAGSGGTASPVTPSTSAPRFPSSEAQPPPGAVSIPDQRAPMPQRPSPLSNPVTCAFPAATQFPSPKPVTPPPDGAAASTGTVAVTLKTTAGDIGLTLDRALAPCAVTSFVALAKQGFYTGTMCHRLGTQGVQMLQCGDPSAVGDPATDGQGGPGYTIKDENFLQIVYGRGILAMAKTSQPDSGGSQFFMVYGEAPIPPDYAVFGSITDGGLQVLDKVARGGFVPGKVTEDGTGLPAIPVKFTDVTVSG